MARYLRSRRGLLAKFNELRFSIIEIASGINLMLFRLKSAFFIAARSVNPAGSSVNRFSEAVSVERFCQDEILGIVDRRLASTASDCNAGNETSSRLVICS